MDNKIKQLLGNNRETEMFLEANPIEPSQTSAEIIASFNSWRKARQRKMDESAVEYLGNMSCLTGPEAMVLGNARSRLWRNNY